MTFRNKLCNRKFSHTILEALESRGKKVYLEMDTQPEYIKGGSLRDHQLTGLNWLAYSWHAQNNVILADEMGLGKTIQTIAFLSYLMHSQNISRPFLIVVPLSTLPNWYRELQKWLPEAYIINFQGNKVSRDLIKSHELFFGAPISKAIPKFNVLLTNYEMLLIESKTLQKINWRVIAIDEGQKLKNQK